MATQRNAHGRETVGAKADDEISASVTRLTRDVAEVLAWTDYSTVEPAVVELVLLAFNTPSKVTKFRALRALEFFDPTAIEEPEPARPPHPAEHSEVDDALASLKWVLYGWSREGRIRAASRCCTIVEQLAARAS